jgi:hypothetical protein
MNLSPIASRVHFDCLVLLGSVLSLSGCGSSQPPFPRAGVSGTVTINGQPASSLLIAFVPQGNVKGPRSSALVKDGKYSLDEQTGPLVGPMRVEITTALEEDEPRDGQVKPFTPERIPAQYNANSQLKAEVKAHGPNKFDFPLQSTIVGATR